MRLLLPLVFLLLGAVSAASDYYERLNLKPLTGGALLASFHFISNTTSTAFDQQNFRHFPRSLGQILQHAHTKELHLRFSTGRWDDESWLARPWDGSREGGTGVEAWAWVEGDDEEKAEARWQILMNALSGLFCASINFIDSTKTIRPVLAFTPEGRYSAGAMDNLHLLHGSLPHEVVCTENLTPFLKLLPCKGKAGISTLLDGHKLFDASWQSMAIDIRPICEAGGAQCILQVEQTVDMVLDIERSKRPRDNPIPRPLPIESINCDTSKPYNSEDSCYPIDNASELPWSLEEVFGRPITGSCSLENDAELFQEVVCLTVPEERTVEVQTTIARPELSRTDPETRCYRLSEGHTFDIRLPEQTISGQIPDRGARLSAHRGITGHGQERGGVKTVLTNPSFNDTVELVYLETLPWFMKSYLHTLQTSIRPSYAKGGFRGRPHPIKEIYYRPGVDRLRPTHLELLLSIPPASVLTLTYDFEKALLRYTEYPPDANRGFDAGPAIIKLLPPNSTEDMWQRGSYLRTTSLLLYLPTPDFSMPYNVIMLTSTVMALGFGSIFNLMVRRFVAADEVGPSKFKRLPALLRGRIQGLFARIKSKGPKRE